MKVLLVVTAILVAMSASAHAGYSPARAEASKPASVKAAIATSGSHASTGKSAGRGRPANKASSKVSSAKAVGNSAAYIQGWLKALKNDRTLLVHAAAQGHKAADYILNEQPEELEAALDYIQGRSSCREVAMKKSMNKV
jgi:antirestriction protein ArdC